MNKTEYMNLLQHEMQDLPSDVQARVKAEIEQKFASGIAEGQSEAEICNKLSHPRVVAAQARANTRFQHLKKDFSIGNFFGLLIALIGLMIFNLIMIIPAFAYGAFLFASYIGSLAVWVAGVGVLAASMSGVPEVKINAGPQHWHSHSHYGYDHKHYGMRNIRVDVNEHGISIDDQGAKDRVEERAEVSHSAMHVDGEVSTITIKNQMQGRHFALGAVLLGLGTGFLLLCLMLTRLTFVGVKKYLLWNISVLRAPFAA